MARSKQILSQMVLQGGKQPVVWPGKKASPVLSYLTLSFRLNLHYSRYFYSLKLDNTFNSLHSSHFSFPPQALIAWQSLLFICLFPHYKGWGHWCLPFLILFDQGKRKSPSNKGLSVLPTFSQLIIFSAAMYSIFTNPHCCCFNFHLYHCGGYSFRWAFLRAPPPSGVHPPLQSLTEPGLCWAATLPPSLHQESGQLSGQCHQPGCC